MEFKSGKIEGNMVRKKSDPTCFELTLTDKGKYSKSTFKVLRQYKNFACVEFKPHTGRTHQIRVHSSSFGNPIFGDIKYGGGLKKSNEYADDFRRISSRVISRFKRHALHATSIEFELMNSNGKKLKLNSPIPDELIELEKDYLLMKTDYNKLKKEFLDYLKKKEVFQITLLNLTILILKYFLIFVKNLMFILDLI